MKKFNSIKAYLKTVSEEEKNTVQWAVEALMVEYWEMLIKDENEEGEEYGSIVVPVNNNYLIISLTLKWYKLKVEASVYEVKVIDTVEWMSTYQDNKQWMRGAF